MLQGCGKAPAPPVKDKNVGFVVVKQGDSSVFADLPGRTSAYQTSEVRPQITGVIRRRLFTEGALVKAGQPLYEIDPSIYNAAASEADANLKSAVANAEAARAIADRYKPLAQIEAVSKQDYTNAVAAARQADATIAQRKAQLETARVNLRFTTVPAPITGRIGRSLATVGALATAGQATSLAQINQLDPIFVDIQQSASQMISLRRALAKDGQAPTDAQVQLALEDGSDYGVAGRVKFSETLVDPTTGTVTLRAEFPNPQGLLLPGMFVRARFAQIVERGIFLVPQAAVTRDASGKAQVFIVGPGDKIEIRKIDAERTEGINWVVKGGLKAGDRIVVQGSNGLKPDQKVKAVPADTPQKVAPPGQNGAGSGSRPGAAG
jgi:membrane fusion protein (multidrug efflux system)